MTPLLADKCGKDRQTLIYTLKLSTTITEPILTKLTPAWLLFVKNIDTEFRENSIGGLVDDSGSVTDRRMDGEPTYGLLFPLALSLTRT